MKYISTVQQALDLIGDHHIIAFDFEDIEQIRTFLRMERYAAYGRCKVLNDLIVQVDKYNRIYEQLRDAAGEDSGR